MLERVLEAEVMDTAEEAAEYDAMDFTEVNARFANDALNARGAGLRSRWLDVGTGTARIPIELARADPSIHITAVDLSADMLRIGRKNVEEAGLTGRISLEHVDAKGLPYANASFDCVVSNSIIHHIPVPIECLRELVRLVAPGGTLFVRDLFRPENVEAIDELVDRYAGTDSNRGRGLFRDSLQAALTVDEVRSSIATLDLPGAVIAATSDRHWTLAWRRSNDA